MLVGDFSGWCTWDLNPHLAQWYFLFQDNWLFEFDGNVKYFGRHRMACCYSSRLPYKYWNIICLEFPWLKYLNDISLGVSVFLPIQICFNINFHYLFSGMADVYICIWEPGNLFGMFYIGLTKYVNKVNRTATHCTAKYEWQYVSNEM